MDEAKPDTAEQLAEFQAAPCARRSVFSGPRNVRRATPRGRTLAAAAALPLRGCEDLH